MARANEAKWKRIVASVKAGSKGGRAGQWSARKAQLAARKYKSSGGTYRGGKSSGQKSLSRWSAQKWRTSNGKKASGRKGGMARYLPDAVWRRLTPAQRRATNTKKKKGSRSGKQFVANTKAARGSSSRRKRKYRRKRKRKR